MSAAPNNQIILEEVYVDPSEDEIVEYAQFLGIDPQEDQELMWIARQGVMAPLPKGWRAIQDPQGDLYYFNFETGESIWDHPCDEYYKNLVVQERKILLEKGKAEYRQPEPDDPRLSALKGTRSPPTTMKATSAMSTIRSTSTLSEVVKNPNFASKSLRNDYGGIYDTREIKAVEFEEENEEKDEEDEEEASEKSKSEESDDSSNGFKKPVDFGIDKQTSLHIDRLERRVGKDKSDKSSNPNRASNDSMSTTSRDNMESPRRAYAKAATGLRDEDLDGLRKSSDIKSSMEFNKQLESISEDQTINHIKNQKDIKVFQQILDKEFDQKRLELLEEKDLKLKNLKEEIESDLARAGEVEKRKLLKEQEERIKDLRTRMQRDLEVEQDELKKRQAQILSNMQKEFDNEKQLRKEKFAMQVSKYIQDTGSADHVDENEERREIAIYFEHIEKKYADKLDERKRELQLKYEKKTKELEKELKAIYEDESERKHTEMRMIKEQNLRVESYEKQMDKILSEKVKEFKEKEAHEFNEIKKEYDVKIKAFREKYKELEEKEFEYLESEFKRRKEKMETEYSTKLSNMENKLKSDQDRLIREEADLKKRLQVIEERRKNFDIEWNKLNEEERRLDDKRAELANRLVSGSGSGSNQPKGSEGDELKLKYEIERLKLEKTDLEAKFENVQKLLGKFYKGMGGDPAASSTLQKAFGQHGGIGVLPTLASKLEEREKDLDRSIANSEELEAKLEGLDNLVEIEDENDDDEIKELIKHAKLKLKLKYYNAKKLAEIDNIRSTDNDAKRMFDSDQDENDSDDDFRSSESYKLDKMADLKSNNQESVRKESSKLFDAAYNKMSLRRANIDIEAISDQKRYLIENIAKEKDALHIANELMEKYRESLLKRQLQLETAKIELRDQEKSFGKSKPSPSQVYQLEEKRLTIDKAQIEVDQLNMNLKNGKRLILQKRAQLNLLENNLLDYDGGNQSESDVSNDEVENSLSSVQLTTSKNTNTINVYQTSETNAFSDLSMNELLLKLQNLQTNGELDLTNMQRIQPILKKLPKLNRKLQMALQSLNTNNVENRNADSELVKLASFVEEKWQRYMGMKDFGKTSTSNGLDSLASKSNPLNKLYVSNLMNTNQFKSSWENSPAYQRLTFDSGTRMLDEKWNQYIGDRESSSALLNNLEQRSRPLRPSNSSSGLLANDLKSISKIVDYASTSKLPEGTLHRINQHRDWLKRFKAENSKVLM